MFSDNFGVVDNRFLSSSLGSLDPRVPVTLPEEATLEKGILSLKSNKIGAVLITNLGGQLSGILTERDILMKVDVFESAQRSLPISHFMTRDPETAYMTTSIAFGLNMLSQGGYRHLPIVDDENYPVGMISVRDIIDYIVSTLTMDLLALKCDLIGE